MRTSFLLGAIVLLASCATTPSPGQSFESRLPRMGAIISAAKAQPWGADLKQIPATVIEVGDLASVPYISFVGGDVELNVYGDPDRPAGIEVGTKSESPEVREALRAFIGGLLPERDRQPLSTLPDGQEVANDGLALEITPPGAPDGFGAWWVTAFHPVGIQAAKASVGELNELSLNADDLSAPPTFVDDVGMHPSLSRYTRIRPMGPKVWATSYYKDGGVYRRRK